MNDLLTKRTNGLEKPSLKPKRPYFCSGPCAKPPGWSLSDLQSAALSRSHRSPLGLEKLREVAALLRKVLEVPNGYELALISGSATGATETLLWNLLGRRAVDVLSQDIFGDRWIGDVFDQLKLEGTSLKGEFGSLPDVTRVRPDRDCVFVWNGSTSGVMYSEVDWIRDSREGLVLCDATSAAFVMPLPWKKLDAVSFSFQKGLGSEAGLGVIILGPRALEHLKTHEPSWPIPYLYKLRHKGEVNSRLFEGMTLNTISLLIVEDILNALKWAEALGGIKALTQKARINFERAEAWIRDNSYLDFCVSDPRIRSYSTLTFKPLLNKEPTLSREAQWQLVRSVGEKLAQEKAGYDVINHMLAKEPSFRLWCGPTVQVEDLERLFPWFDWAVENAFKDLS